MSLEEEFRGTSEEIIDTFSSDEGVVSLVKNEDGRFVRTKFANGEYKSKYYFTMTFAKRHFNRLCDKYEKREEL